MFQNFKMQSFDQKRKRLNIMFHYMKYWKDYINYRKFMMGAQVQALHFTQSMDFSLLKSCFDAIRQNKEEEKYSQVDYELNTVEKPMVQELSQNLQEKTMERDQKAAQKAGNVMCKLANKGIYQYFDKWRTINQQFKEVPQTKMKGRIIKAYYDKIRLAFNRWKVLLKAKEIQTNE